MHPTQLQIFVHPTRAAVSVPTGCPREWLWGVIVWVLQSCPGLTFPWQSCLLPRSSLSANMHHILCPPASTQHHPAQHKRGSFPIHKKSLDEHKKSFCIYNTLPSKLGWLLVWVFFSLSLLTSPQQKSAVSWRISSCLLSVSSLCLVLLQHSLPGALLT